MKVSIVITMIIITKNDKIYENSINFNNYNNIIVLINNDNNVMIIVVMTMIIMMITMQRF